MEGERVVAVVAGRGLEGVPGLGDLCAIGAEVVEDVAEVLLAQPLDDVAPTVDADGVRLRLVEAGRQLGPELVAIAAQLDHLPGAARVRRSLRGFDVGDRALLHPGGVGDVVTMGGVVPGEDERGGNDPGGDLALAVQRLPHVVGELHLRDRLAVVGDRETHQLHVEPGTDVDALLGAQVGLDLVGRVERRWRRADSRAHRSGGESRGRRGSEREHCDGERGGPHGTTPFTRAGRGDRRRGLSDRKARSDAPTTGAPWASSLGQRSVNDTDPSVAW